MTSVAKKIRITRSSLRPIVKSTTDVCVAHSGTHIRIILLLFSSLFRSQTLLRCVISPFSSSSCLQLAVSKLWKSDKLKRHTLVTCSTSTVARNFALLLRSCPIHMFHCAIYCPPTMFDPSKPAAPGSCRRDQECGAEEKCCRPACGCSNRCTKAVINDGFLSFPWRWSEWHCIDSILNTIIKWKWSPFLCVGHHSINRVVAIEFLTSCHSFILLKDLRHAPRLKRIDWMKNFHREKNQERMMKGEVHFFCCPLPPSPNKRRCPLPPSPSKCRCPLPSCPSWWWPSDTEAFGSSCFSGLSSLEASTESPADSSWRSDDGTVDIFRCDDSCRTQWRESISICSSNGKLYLAWRRTFIFERVESKRR